MRKEFIIMALSVCTVAQAQLFGSNVSNQPVTTDLSTYAQNDMQAAAQAFQQGDKISGFAHLKVAAEAGDPAAAYNLSVAYSNGDGTAVNMQEALKWLEISANQAYPPAQYDLALYYLSQKQAAQAAPLLKILADKGNPPAQFNYGMMLLRGDGVSVDSTMGKAYIEKAAAQNFPPAQQVLAKIK